MAAVSIEQNKNLNSFSPVYKILIPDETSLNHLIILHWQTYIYIYIYSNINVSLKISPRNRKYRYF